MKEIFDSKTEINLVILGAAVFTAALLLGIIIRKWLLVISNKKKNEEKPLTNAFFISIAKSITLLLVALFFYIGKAFFDFSGILNQIVIISSGVLLTVALGVWAYHLIEIPNLWYLSYADKNDNATSKMLSPVFKKALQVVVILIVVAQVFQVVSQKPLTPILASFGIVGAAVALASQDTFKNFFGSFVIAGDKPFEIGERVVIDGYDGIVESIGMRSTRIKTLDDHLVTIPNGVLANKTIQNIGKRTYIKRSFTLNLTYNTSPEKIQQAIEIVRNILKDHEGMNPEFEPRVYFKELNSYSLDIMVLYWYFPPNFWDYMEFSQKVNLQIVEQFNNAGIQFAFPTQSIEVLKNA